jgi:hypothetical protein
VLVAVCSLAACQADLSGGGRVPPQRILEHVRRIAGGLRARDEQGGGDGDRRTATRSAMRLDAGRSRWRRAVPAVVLITAGLAVLVIPADGQRSSKRAHPAALQASPGTVLWSNGMEDGTLDGWGGAAMNGGGEFNSDSGVSTASREVAHSGSWSAKMTLPDGSGGTRLFRWQEPRQHRDLVYSAWFYMPQAYTLTGNLSSRFWNLFQFKSRSTSDSVDPMWELTVSNPSPGRMHLNLDWSPQTLEGPQPGQSSFRRFTHAGADVPVARWFQLTAQLRQSNGFDGALRIWQDGQLLFDLAGIRTSYANCAFNPWCGSNEWSINSYSDSLSPAPAVIYADDASIVLPDAAASSVARPARRAFRGLMVGRRQRGTSVRGRVRIARKGSRFAAILRTVDRRRIAGRAPRRRVRAGILRFRIPLTRGQRMRLRRTHAMSLRVRITVTPPGGAAAWAERRVDLRP